MNLIIGSSDYELSFVDKIENEDNILGQTDFCDKTIEIIEMKNIQSQRQLFYHEITHAFLEEIGEAELCENEIFVDALSKQIYGFFARNNLDEINEFLDAA